MSDMSAKTNEAKTDKPEVTYVSGYDDPEADMILKTNDGGLFRVHSYYLKTYSVFFRSMAAPAQLGPQCSNYTVDIDGNASALRTLLGQVISANPPLIYDWNDVEPMIRLAEQYQFDHLHCKLALSIGPCTLGHPEKVFKYASQHDLEPLAKRAVGCFKGSDHWRQREIKELRRTDFAGVTFDYALALIRAMRVGEKPAPIYTDWDQVAQVFVVRR